MNANSLFHLRIEQAAYIAGLIDGEGTITLSRLHKGEMRRLVISIASTEKPLLTFVREATGFGRVTSKRTYRQNHAPGYTYYVTSRQALMLLGEIAPYLRSYKRIRAELALAHYIALTPRNGKYDEGQREMRAQFEQQFLATKANPLPEANVANNLLDSARGA
jgi:hypothetical protein